MDPRFGRRLQNQWLDMVSKGDYGGVTGFTQDFGMSLYGLWGIQQIRGS